MSIAPQRVPLDLHLRIAVFRRDGYRCAHCGRDGSYRDFEVDHITPWSWDGEDHFDNLQTLCVRCNRRKGNRYSG